jgi:hypothetical protein
MKPMMISQARMICSADEGFERFIICATCRFRQYFQAAKASQRGSRIETIEPTPDRQPYNLNLSGFLDLGRRVYRLCFERCPALADITLLYRGRTGLGRSAPPGLAMDELRSRGH